MGKQVNVVLNLKDAFSSPLKKIAEKLGKTEKEIKKATNTIKAFGKQAGQAFRNAVLGAVAMGAALVGAFAVATKTTLSYAKEVKTMMRLTGESVRNASLMVAVGKKYNISAEGMAKSLRMLGIKAANGGKDFKKYGLDVKDSHGQLLPASIILEKVADKYKELGGGLKGAIFAQKLMGKSAMEMVPLLSKGSSGLKAMEADAARMGLVLSEKNMADFAKFAEGEKRFKQAMLGINVTIGSKVLPVLGQLGEKLNVALTKFDFRKVGIIATQIFNGIGNAIKFVANNLNWIIPIASAALGSIIAFKAITAVMTVFTTLKNVIAAVNVVQGIWNALLLANPIGLVAVGIGLLVGAVALLIMNWKTVCSWASAFWSWLKKLGAEALKFTGLMQGINNIKSAVNIVKTITTKTSPTKKPPGHATGTSYFAGGLTGINEGGRSEIVNLPSGSQIIPHDIAKKSGGGMSIKFGDIIIQGNVIGNQEFLNEMGNMFAIKVKTALANI